MRRLVGSLLVLHGFAHAGAGYWTTTGAPPLLVALLWWVAMVGFLAAGAGLIGVPWLDQRYRPLAVVAAIASLALLTFYPHPVPLIGAAIDGMVLIDSIPFAHRVVTRDLGLMLNPPRRHLGKIGTGVVVAILAYVSAVVLTRPWQATWGMSDREHVTPPPGDEPTLASVTIAPFGLLVVEPAHFIMQRSTLRGIPGRAETARREQ